MLTEVKAGNIAFKEWAVVVEALLSGRQTILLRKGGIVEERGAFSVDHSRFLLFPTFAHQNAEDLIPEERSNLKRLHGAKNLDSVEIKGWVQAEQVHFLENWETVKRVQPFGIWSIKCLEERFHWGGRSGIHLIVGRVYRLKTPATFPMLKSYGGCKSWVELARSVSLQDSSPVLTDAQFSGAVEKITAAISLSGT